VKPEVLLTRRIPSAVVSRLESVCDVEVYEGPEAITADELKERLPGKQALICLLTDPVTEDVLAAGTALKVVANIAVGYDNIAVAAAKARGIVVTNTPDVLTEAVAEFTWGLILGITRRIGEGERVLRRGEWKGWALDFMLGTELRGKQLGIIGRGRIGQAVAAKAPAFGMTAVYAPGSGSAKPMGTGQLRFVGSGPNSRGAAANPGLTPSLDQLLLTSDVISVHAPATAATRHLIDRRALARMKRSAVLINTARGSIVDEEALVWALRERLIAGAALDVYEREPAVHPDLLTMDNVILTPHLGSATRETRTAMADLAVSNVLAVLDGRSPVTPV
jgi:glyoxylate reductase